MAEFRSKWLDWKPKSKRDETSVSFVSGLVARSQKQAPAGGERQEKKSVSPQPPDGKEESGEINDSGQESCFQKRPTMALTKLPKALAEAPGYLTRAEHREKPGAVRLESRFGSIWIALNLSMAAELQAEEQARETPRPVLLPEDVASLRGKSQAMVRGALNVLAEFPGTKVIQ